MATAGSLGPGGSTAPGSNPLSSLYDATGGSGAAGGANIPALLGQLVSMLQMLLPLLMGGAGGSASPNGDPSQSPGGGNDSASGSPTSDSPASGGATQSGQCPGATPGSSPTGPTEPTGGGDPSGGTSSGLPPDSNNSPPINAPPNNSPPNNTPTPTPTSGGGGGAPTKTGNQAMDRWDNQIAAAAKSTGLPPNYIKATMWAESRGNPSDPSQNPDGQHTDEGVMQISDYTYGDVQSNQANAPKGLKAGNPADNIMMGAWELKDKLERSKGDFHATSKAYVGTGDENHDNTYANNVLMYMNELNNHQPLTDN